jgi:hypothetical protein
MPSKIRALTDQKEDGGEDDFEDMDLSEPAGAAPANAVDPPSTELDASTEPENASNIKLVTKDLKSMGLAAGGKLGTF